MEKETKRELPEAFVEKMEKLLGSDAEAFFKSYDAERKFGLRVNPLKQKSGEMPEEGEPLGDYLKGLAKVPWAEEGFYYEADMRPGRHPFHEAGAYYIQEPSAMSVAEALSPKPGEQILDLCAAREVNYPSCRKNGRTGAFSLQRDPSCPREDPVPEY